MLKRKGFTLVELLIVIVIIGILAAALIPKLTALQSRARDVQRRTDIQNIATALMLYYTDHGTYPTESCNATPEYFAGGGYANICAWDLGLGSFSMFSGFLTELEGGYLKSLPKDPQEALGGTYSYYFDPNINSARNVYIREHCNTSYNSVAMLTYSPEKRREDDIVRSCPNGISWDFIAHNNLNRYSYFRSMRLYDDKYAPLGGVKVLGEIFEKD